MTIALLFFVTFKVKIIYGSELTTSLLSSESKILQTYVTHNCNERSLGGFYEQN